MNTWMGELEAILNLYPEYRLVLAILLGVLALVLVPGLVVPAWRRWRHARLHREWESWARSAPGPLDEVAAELDVQRRAAVELWSGYMPQLRTPALPAPRAAALHGPRAASEGAQIIHLRPRTTESAEPASGT